MFSYNDQFPEYNGQKVEIRGKDGYYCATDLSKVLGKRFTDWRKTDFGKRLLVRLSANLDIPIDWGDSPSRLKTPLVDYIRGDKQKQWIHPTVAMSYAMSNPEFQADVNTWIWQLTNIGTVNPHFLAWTKEEFEQGVQYNRDDINEMYPR